MNLQEISATSNVSIQVDQVKEEEMGGACST